MTESFSTSINWSRSSDSRDTISHSGSLPRLRIIDVHDPAKPRLLGTVETYNARDVAVIPGYAFVADDTQGVRVINIEDPLRPFEVTRVDTVEARAIKVYGIYAYVADGPAGVCIIDVSEPTTSHVVSSLDLNGENDPRPNHANELVLYTSFSKRLPAQNSRTIGREILYVADGYAGLRVVDVSHPEAPQVAAAALAQAYVGLLDAAMFENEFELSQELLSKIRGIEPEQEKVKALADAEGTLTAAAKVEALRATAVALREKRRNPTASHPLVSCDTYFLARS